MSLHFLLQGQKSLQIENKHVQRNIRRQVYRGFHPLQRSKYFRFKGFGIFSLRSYRIIRNTATHNKQLRCQHTQEVVTETKYQPLTDTRVVFKFLVHTKFIIVEKQYSRVMNRGESETSRRTRSRIDRSRRSADGGDVKGERKMITKNRNLKQTEIFLACIKLSDQNHLSTM